jgi:hypothetical protein
MEIIKKRKKLRERVVEKASEWAKGLPFKVTAILFGSYAKGDFNLWSDVDILLVSDEFKGNPVERLKPLDIPAGFQVIPLTLKEFERLAKKEEHLATEALKFGIVLREDFKLVPST